MRHFRALLLVLCLVAPAAAADHPQTARTLSLRSAARASLTWKVRAPSPVPPSSNPLVAGATLRVFGAGGEIATMALPAGSNWKANAAGTAFTYRNALAPGGPSAVKRVRLTGGALTVTTRSTGITLDEAMQGTVAITLQIGADLYCSSCAAPARDQPGRFVARACPPPAVCAQPPATTTSSITTTTGFGTTTTTLGGSGICGNGVIDQPSEQCDVGQQGICPDLPPPFGLACDVPTSPTPCTCCSPGTCFFQSGQWSPCCNGAECQDTTGVGQVRGGACIPPTCTQASDCHGYGCAGGTCCAAAGQFCGVVDCCPGSNATCSSVAWIGASVCCRAAGGTCTQFNQCCSGSCTGGVCD